MVAPALGLIAGLVQGYAQNKKNEKDKALADMKQSLMMAQMKTQQEQTKLAQTWAKNFAPVMAQKISTDQGQQQAKQDAVSPTEPTTVFGDSFNVTETPGAGVLDQMVGGQQEQPAQTQPPQFSPEQLAGLQVASGGEIPGIAMGGLQQRVRADERLERQGQERIDLTRRRQEFEEQKVTMKPVTIDGKPYLQGFDPKGNKVGEPVVTGGKKPLSADVAGKLQMSKGGLQDMSALTNLIMPNGKVDRTLLAQMSAPGGGLPFSKSRDANALFLNAAEAKIRIESGAAVPDEEIARLAQRFRPSILDLQLGSKDPDSVIRSKLERLTRFLSGTVELLDPNKVYSPDTEFIVGTNGEKYAWEPSVSMTQEEVNKALVEAMKKAIKD